MVTLGYFEFNTYNLVSAFENVIKYITMDGNFLLFVKADYGFLFYQG